MSRHQEENRFRKTFLKDAKTILRGAECYQSEYCLYPALDLLKREFYERDGVGNPLKRSKPIGRIDLYFRYKRRNYAGEIKFQPYEGGDFWDALKCLGYATYMNWQNQILPGWEKVYPAIFMPKPRVRLEHRVVAAQLGIALFSIESKDDGFTAHLESE